MLGVLTESQDIETTHNIFYANIFVIMMWFRLKLKIIDHKENIIPSLLKAYQQHFIFRVSLFH